MRAFLSNNITFDKNIREQLLENERRALNISILIQKEVAKTILTAQKIMNIVFTVINNQWSDALKNTPMGG